MIVLWYVVAWTHDGISVALQDKAGHRREGGKGDGEEMEGERERESASKRGLMHVRYPQAAPNLLGTLVRCSP